MTDWDAGELKTNGITLHYYRTGGDKPPLVLSHGITDNGLCWTRVARELAREYDVVMVDARGHGLSDAPEEGYAPEDHATDLAGLIEGLDLGQPGLIGHSMGASIVATLAANFPHLVRGAILEDPPWRPRNTHLPSDEQEARMEEWRASILERKSRSRQEIIAHGREIHPNWDEQEFDAWAEAKSQVSPNVAKFVLDRSTPWTDLVPKITCPTLLVTGDPELSAIVTPQIAAEAAELNPNLEVVRINGAGHNIRREGYEAYLAAVTAFLQENVYPE